MSKMKKRLYKSRNDKKIDGVCAGIANFFNIDPTLVRAIYALVTIFSAGFPGILVYIALAFIIPVEPDEQMPPQ